MITYEVLSTTSPSAAAPRIYLHALSCDSQRRHGRSPLHFIFFFLHSSLPTIRLSAQVISTKTQGTAIAREMLFELTRRQEYISPVSVVVEYLLLWCWSHCNSSSSSGSLLGSGRVAWTAALRLSKSWTDIGFAHVYLMIII